MRLTFTEDEFDKLLEVLQDSNQREMATNLIEKKKIYNKSITTNKRTATAKASELKVARAKERVINSVEMMLINKDKINVNTVTAHSGLAYNTVKKYKYLIENRK